MIDTKCLQDLLDEVTAAIDPAEDELRGLEKYLRLPLRLGTLAEVEALLARYQRRVGLVRTLARALQDTIACVKAVLDDGYPDLPVSVGSAGVAEDLDKELANLSSARKGIRPLADGAS